MVAGRVAALSIAILCSSLPARAVTPPPHAVITAVAYTYLPGDTREPPVPLHVPQGESLLFANLDTLDVHTVTSAALNEEQAPLFDSGAVQTARAAGVRGVEALPPGRYSFYCRLHWPGMAGELIINPA